MRKGQTVKVKTAWINKARQIVPADYTEEFEAREFTLIRNPTNNNPYYMLLIDDDVSGWKIGIFHVEFMGVDNKYLNKKFFEVDISYFVTD